MARLLLCVLGFVLIGCAKSDVLVDPPAASVTSSFRHIQNRVFSVSCVQCHAEPASDYFGGLALKQEDSSYLSLVGMVAHNAAAAAEGLQRVERTKPETSFLMMKLEGHLKVGMGDAMPQHLAPLPHGKIEFIRQWIAAGAPRTDSVADPALLDDDGSQPDLVPLTPPAAGTGFQIHMDTFLIEPAQEREIFLYQERSALDTEFVNRVKIRMREGSHHLVLYTLDGLEEGVETGEKRSDVGGELGRGTRKYVFGAQTAESEIVFPDSIAFALPPSAGFDLNSHYVNPTPHIYSGEAYINVYTVPRSQVKHVAIPMLLNDGGFFIPPHSTKEHTHVWPSSSRIRHYIMLTSHHHKRMKDFKLYVSGGPRDGELVFSNTDWHNPPVKMLDLVINPGERLRSVTTWENESDRMIQFGYTSEDEMNILLGYYWQ